MSEEGATGQTGGGAGGDADEAMSVDSGIDGSASVASPGSTVSDFSGHPSESGSGSSTITGASVHSTHTVNAPGHQQSHDSGISSLRGHSEQHSGQSHSTFGQSHSGQAQRPGQTMAFPGQRVDQSSVDSGISSGRTPGSGSNPNLPSEKVDTAARTDQWVEESFQVFVKNLDGRTHTIEVNLDEEVTTFRRKVCQTLGIPGEQQRLTLQEGRTLEDGRRLRDYQGFKKHCTIYCQGRLRGGQGF